MFASIPDFFLSYRLSIFSSSSAIFYPASAFPISRNISICVHLNTHTSNLSPPTHHSPSRDAFIQVMLRYTPSLSTERADLIMAEILSDLNSDCSGEKSSVEGVEGEEEKVVGDTSAGFTKDAWCNYMASWLQVRYYY
jgi:hypothetical protein